MCTFFAEPVSSQPDASMECQVVTETDSSKVATDIPAVKGPSESTSYSDTVTPETGGFFAGVGHFPPVKPAVPGKTEASQLLMNMTTDQQTCLRSIENLFFDFAQAVFV